MTITDRLADLREERTERRDFARALFRSLLREDFYATDPRTLELVIRAAKREDYTYAHYLGEPMPDHLREALTTEVQTWIALYSELTATPVPESAYATLCADLRPRVISLIDLITVETEMLSNPLARHYETWLRDYHAYCAP